MIIYNGDKYACVSCIRGHRSSTCKHAHRMLVKVRTRGRPSPMEIRDVIMVDVNSMVKREPHRLEDGGVGGGTDATDGCCSKKMLQSQPIIFVKVKETQKARMVHGKLQILIPKEGIAEVNNDEDYTDFISEKEFLRTHSFPRINTGNIDDNLLPEENCNSVTLPNSQLMTPCPNRIPFHASNGFLQNQEPLQHQRQGQNTPISNESLENFVSPTSTHSSTDQLPLDYEQTDQKRLKVDVFTPKGIFLSSDCSCDPQNCQCMNCVLHRNEEELSNYIKQSGVPLTNLTMNNEISQPNMATSCSVATCKCSIIDCMCAKCSRHPTEILPFEKIYYHGLFNITLRKKTIIRFKQKLIPSEYWWEFLTQKLPNLSDSKLYNLDLNDWFENLLKKHFNEFLDADSDWCLLNDLEGFYVI